MAIAKKISSAIAASCLLGLAVCTPATFADTTNIGLLNPLLSPQDQKWRATAGADLSSVLYNGVTVTAGAVGGADDLVQLFHRQIPILVQDGYAVDFWLKVIDVQQPHNTFDAGIAFYAGTQDPSRYTFTGSPRAQLIYFDEDGIGWGDETDTFALDTTDDFHHYRVEVDSDGAARVLVDGELALQRANFKAYPHVAFGDATNEAGLNGRYAISSVSVTGFTATPWPVDVRPSNCPNPGINGRSTKSVPIAIAGFRDAATTLDVSQIDPATVRVNGLAPKGWSIRHATTPTRPFNNLGEQETAGCASVGRDGLLDLVVAFEERALAAAVGASAVTGQQVRLRVTGKLKPEFGGHGFAGEDLVSVYNVPAP